MHAPRYGQSGIYLSPLKLVVLVIFCTFLGFQTSNYLLSHKITSESTNQVVIQETVQLRGPTPDLVEKPFVYANEIKSTLVEKPFVYSNEIKSTHSSFCHKKLKERKEIASYLNDLGLKGDGVEIGVRDGGFSDWTLKNWKGNKLNLGSK